MTRRARTGAILAALPSLASTAFLLLPLAALLLHVSWRGAWGVWAGAAWQPLWTSLWTTLVTMAVVILCGTPTGWAIARRRGGFWRAVEWLLFIPLLLPPLVAGLLLMYVYGPYGGVGRLLSAWGLSASNTSLAVILAQLYESFPYYVFACQAAFRQIDRGLEQMSLALGSSPRRTFLRVTLPLAAPGVSAGLAMSFARALGAFGAVIIVAYYPQTLPVGIWVALQERGLPAALPLALLLLIVSLPLPLGLVVWRGIRHAAA